MSAYDDRSRNMFNPASMPDQGQAAPFVGIVSSEESVTGPLGASEHEQGPMRSMILSPTMTRPLTESLPGLIDATEGRQRSPVVIRGKMRRTSPLSRTDHPLYRKVASLAGIGTLFLIISLSLLTATPLGHNIGLNFNPSQAGKNAFGVSSASNNSINLIPPATATAISHQQTDGYDPTANGNVTVYDTAGSLSWPLGVCTYWANIRYHQLTGHWVSWGGNAYQWAAGAGAAGWNVSTTPHVPSIMVLMPGVQYASGYGHVAVVESIVNSTTVSTSNMNWFNGGGWDIVSNYNFNYGPGYPGVYFVWR